MFAFRRANRVGKAVGVVAVVGIAWSTLAAMPAGAAPGTAAPGTAEASADTATTGYVDVVTFGDPESERAHDFDGGSSSVVDGANGQRARVAHPRPDKGTYLEDLRFTMRVDPVGQNHFTLKFWGEDVSSYKTVVLVNGEQASYQNTADYEPINAGTGRGMEGRFFYSTMLLPLVSTQGQNEVEITVRTHHPSPPSPATADSRPYYEAYTHTAPKIEPAEKDDTGYAPTTQAAPALAPEAEQQFIDSVRTMQVELFDSLSSRADDDPNFAMPISRYQDELRFYAESLLMDWSPAQSDEQKRAALERIFQSIDVYTRQYYGDVKSLGNGGHQSDWGGYYAALGEALYIVEKLIADADVYGVGEFSALLDEPFETGTANGPNSIEGVDWDGGELTRREAWERVLKANFDFARSRLSYIYNQMMYTYEGAWKAHEGLRVIGSEFYEGKERSHQIVGESLGWLPFLGEEVLVGPDGAGLDLYHSLFQHDRNAVYTDDYLQIVMKGHAQSKLDYDGDVVRRKPYGEHYTGITLDGQTRENGYVGNYGESTNYIASWFFRTLGHDGDAAVNDQILKLALRNLHARGQTRYPGMDADGNRVMYMQQVVDDRNTSYPGKIAYGTDVGTGRGLLHPSLEQHMAENAGDYAGEEWDLYWEYAREATGWAQQQLIDNQYFEHFNAVRSNHRYDLRLDKTYEYVTSTRAEYFDSVAAGVVLPHTDLDRYTDEELALLGIDRVDHQEQEFAWVDIDNLFVSMRDGDTQLFGNLHMRNRGFARNGRMHVLNGSHDHLVQIATEGVLEYQEYTLRAPVVEQPMLYDRATDYDISLALAGELSPVAYQPGVGTVERDNWREDTPYSGYPNLVSTRYGEHFIAVNTTREAYGNEQSYTVDLPAGFTGDTVFDLVTGQELAVDDGAVTVEPTSAVVLRLGTNEVLPEPPAPVDVVVATPGQGGVGLTWREAAGAESYTISRANREDGRYATVAEGVTGASYVDDSRERVVGKTFYYKVTPVNEVGVGRPSNSVSATLTLPHTPALQGTEWRDDLIGDETAGATAVDGDTITISGGSGDGFAGGDDSVIYERDMPDSMVLVSRLAQGNIVVSANLADGAGDARGVMLRGSTDAVARYVYVGADDSGNLAVRTRNRNSQADIGTGLAGQDAAGGRTRSPLDVRLGKDYPVEDYPFVKLVRMADAHAVVVLASRDGQDWEHLTTQLVPMVDVINAGVAATDDAAFGDVSVEMLDPGAVVAAGTFGEFTGTVSWTKPKAAVAFDLYRTRDPEVAATDPLESDQWEPVLGDARAWSYEDQILGGEMYYKVVARSLDGTTVVTDEPAHIEAEPLETVLARARALEAEDYTAASWARFTAELDAVEEAMDDPGADEEELIKRVYDSFGLLVDVYNDGFEETDPDVWAPMGAAPATYTRVVDDSGARTGDRSLYFSSTVTTYNGAHNLWFRSNKGGPSPITATPETTYKVSFWYQLTDYVPGRTVGAYYFIRSYSGTAGVGTEQRNWLAAGDTPPGEWRRFERTYTTEVGGVDNVVIDFGFRGSSGAFRVDDLRVEPVDG